MRRRLTAGIVTAVTAAAMTVPAVGLADKGGKPNSNSTPPMCHMHTNKGKHKGTKNATKGKRNGSSKGNKCGRAV